MKTKMSFGLIMLIIVAILMDCYAGQVFFLMTVMSIGPDYPLLYFGTVIIILILFISSVISLFRLKKWAYYIFVALTLIFNSLLSLIYIRYLMKGYRSFQNRLIFLVAFVLTFILYFLKPSTRKLFEKKNVA